MADKDVTATLAAFEQLFSQVVTSNGSPRALDVDTLLLRAEEIFGPGAGGARADALPDAIETATALVEDSAVSPTASPEPASSSHLVGGHRRCARTLFGRIRNERRATRGPDMPTAGMSPLVDP